MSPDVLCSEIEQVRDGLLGEIVADVLSREAAFQARLEQADERQAAYRAAWLAHNPTECDCHSGS